MNCGMLLGSPAHLENAGQVLLGCPAPRLASGGERAPAQDRELSRPVPLALDQLHAVHVALDGSI